MDAALKFCVQLADLGGEALYIIKLIHGVEDAVFEGGELARAIERQRARHKAA